MQAQQGIPRRRREDRRGHALHAARGGQAGQGDAQDQVRRTVDVAMRLGVDPRKADQMVRGTVNLPHGTGKTARVLVFANGEKAEEARSRRRRLRRWRRADQEGQRRLARLRRRRRHPGPDGQGRPSRPRPRPAWSDAEPEDRHRDARTWPRPCPTSRAARSSSGSTGTRTCTSSSARRRSAEPAGGELRRRARRDPSAQAGQLQGPLHARRSRSRPRWAPASRSTRTGPAT